MGYSSDYPSVREWEFKASGYQAGSLVKFKGNIFVADYWAQSEPGKKPKPEEGWALYDELYDITSNYGKLSHSQSSPKIVAYLPTWRDSEHFPYGDESKYRGLTHVIISFVMFSPSLSGQLDLTSVRNVESISTEVVSAAKNHGVKVMVAVGGATDYAFVELMSKIKSDESSPMLEIAADAIHQFVLAHNLDSVDLDLECWWDSEGNSEKDMGGRMKQDGPHPAGMGLSLLAKRLRKIMPDKLISAAVFATSWYGNNYDPGMYASLDWIGIMTYDLTGSWNNSPVGPHTALYKIRDQSKYESEQHGDWPSGGKKDNPIHSVEDALWYWTNPYYVNWQGRGASIPRDKILLGVPIYGYDFSYAKDVDAQSGQVPPGFKVIRYKDIVAQFPDAAYAPDANIKRTGSVARPTFSTAPGAYGFEHNIYYETPKSAIEKMDFIKNVGGQGIIIWELTNDAVGTNSIVRSLSMVQGGLYEDAQINEFMDFFMEVAQMMALLSNEDIMKAT